MKENNPRLLLARLRNGDFSHPGDTEAIDILMRYITPHLNSLPLKILDVRCGRGGTANYIQTTTANILAITGIDIDDQAIYAAQKNYLNISFKLTDIADIDQIIADRYNLIYMFNVYYALPETLKKHSLLNLANIAERDAVLAISDYVSLCDNNAPLLDFAAKPMLPVLMNDLKYLLNNSGWELLEEIDISDKYIAWYRDFLDKMHTKKIALLAEFTEDAYNQVANTFTAILNKIANNIWGGRICYVRLKNQIG
jgi:SAM-dependent methyltransferase